jgi:hypothetical protein
MNPPKLEKVMSSPFTAIFSFLASLIGTKFVEKASLLVHQQDSITSMIEKIGIVLLSGFWFFYIIYGTISWLMYTEYKPKEAGLLPSFEKMLILRFLEFIPFVWLYDIIHILDPEVNHTGRPISRLSLDIGIILLLWSTWRILFKILNNKSCYNDKIIKWKSVIISIFLSSVFVVIFIVLYFYLGDISDCLFKKIRIINSNFCATLLLSIITGFYLISDIKIINKKFYETINGVLNDIVNSSTSR